MYLTIWRHGQAGSASSDRLRELTQAGRDALQTGCQHFKDLCEQLQLGVPDRVLYSEWLRTTQTAELIAGSLGGLPRAPCDALLPGRSPAMVNADLEENWPEGSARHLLLVSHQPLVSALVDFYLDDAGRVAPMLPGAMTTLEMDVFARGCATLKFSAQPPLFKVMI